MFVAIAGHAAGGPGSYHGDKNFSAAWRKGDRIWDIPGLDKYHGQDIYLNEELTIEANRAVDEAVAELDRTTLASVVAQILRALEFIHRRRFVHFDLNSGNIRIIDNDEREVEPEIIDTPAPVEARLRLVISNG